MYMCCIIMKSTLMYVHVYVCMYDIATCVIKQGHETYNVS